MRSRDRTSHIIRVVLGLLLTIALTGAHLGYATRTLRADGSADDTFVDLSLMVSPEYPCTWPQFWPFFQMNHYRRIGSSSAYNSDILVIDPNTGTQIDYPPHSIPRRGTNLPNANEYGSLFADKVAAWKYGGEACVIDVCHLLDKAPKGVSPLIRKEHIMAWEREHRPLREGDVAVLYSGYSDKYYTPLPEGRRFIAEPVEEKAPGWPDPHPDCMEYIAKKGVMHIVTDSPSMGTMPNLQEPTHIAGLKYGAIFTEGATNLGKLPATGAFYGCLGPRHALSPCSEGRAFAIRDRNVARFLIEATRKKQVLDLSVVLAADLPLTWPDNRVGNHRQPYYMINIFYVETVQLYQHTHMMDSNAGTHLVPPVFALPAERFDNTSYAAEVQTWLAEYENKYGPRGTSDMTTEKVPLSQAAGWARVIDVGSLVGTTSKQSWPASPEITVERVQRYEQEHGALKAGQVVLFRSAHIDRTYQRKNDACMIHPMAGTAEGWPAVSADTVMYLAKQGIRCIGTDAPSLGSVDPKERLFTYWALASQGMVAVEFLTHVGDAPKKAYFIFAPIKIKGSHGGLGRAVAYY